MRTSTIGKKLLAGGGIFLVFAIYSLGIRHKRPVIAKPKSLAQAGTSTPSSATSPVASGSSTGSASGSATGNVSSGGSNSGGQYKDGTYTGSVADAFYGNVQVRLTVSGGKITDVKFLQYPNSHSTSVYINQQAMPYLKQEAVQAQSSNVQIISGATFTSQAFAQSLSSALSGAHA